MPAPEFICNESPRGPWILARREGLGGSDCPAILGISPFSTPARVAADKRGLLPDDVEETELMAWGHEIEPLAIAAFLSDMEKAGKKGWTARQSGRMYRCTEPGQEMMLATVDGEATDPAGRSGILEVKLKIFGAAEWEKLGVPDYVVAQGQHNVEVVDADFVVVIGVLGGYRPRWKILERSPALLGDLIVPAELDFWTRLQAGEAFPLDDGRADINLELVKRLYPDDNGKTIKLEGSKYEEAHRVWRTQAERRIAAEKLEKAAKAVLFDAIGENTYGILDDGVQLSLKTQERGEYTAKASKSRVLREDSAKSARAAARARR